MTSPQVSEVQGRARTDSVYEQLSHVNTAQRILLCCKFGAMNTLESYFRWHGRLVASYPVLFMLGTVMTTIMFGLGLISFREEADLTVLWVPVGSKLRNNVEWVKQNFPQQIRFNQVIFKSDNVLRPEVIQEMYNLTMRMREVRHSNQTWEDVCFRVPVISTPPKCLHKYISYLKLFGRRRRRETSGDDWFDDDTDFGVFETDDPENENCTDFKPPSLTASQVAALIPLSDKLEKEGLTMEVASLINQQFYPEPYCSLVSHTPTVCYEESLLELWAEQGVLDREKIFSLYSQDIINSINTRNVSGIFQREKNFTNVLGDVTYNSSGHLVGARVATITWIGKVNLSALREFGPAQRGDLIDKFTFNYEGEMIEVATDRDNLGEGVEIFVNIARMLFETLEGQVFKDLDMLVAGYLIVFVYVLVMLGRFDCVEQKIYLSMGGILGVGMGIIVSYGLCSVLGFFYSAAHAVMPFLLLGIGIDDMFVIVQCLNTLSEQEKSKPIIERMGATMSHAGVAITITSITNFIAFGIGATSSLPALRSFCVYASIGILTIFCFQVTWFVALLTLDERRVERRGNGCCCCFLHRNSRQGQGEDSEDSLSLTQSRGFISRLFGWVSEKLMMFPVKVAVLLTCLSLLSMGVYGMTKLKMEFRPEWMLDPEAEFTSWYFTHKEYFPSDGEIGQLYFKAVNYTKDFTKLENLINDLENQTDIIKNVDSWIKEYKTYVEEDGVAGGTVDWDNISDEEFMRNLTQFLFSPRGARYKNQFKFSSDLLCGSQSPDILVSTINYQHVGFQSASEWVPAMDRVTDMVETSNISVSERLIMKEESQGNTTDAVFPLAMRYSNWETDKIIGYELYQNMLTSLIAIFLTVLVFLGSLRASCIVIFCVATTIVQVAGFMHFWDLTIDVISCNTLVISIGLCVDFSAHIAHGFLSRRGSREQRVSRTLTKIGPAVLNGGLSTLLAFILLSASESYVCLSFFKIFFLICIFGLFNGLVALPVILSVCGPVPQVVEVFPEELDEMSLYTKYALTGINNNKRSVSLSTDRTSQDNKE